MTLTCVCDEDRLLKWYVWDSHVWFGGSPGGASQGSRNTRSVLKVGLDMALQVG